MNDTGIMKMMAKGWFHLFTQDLLPYVLRGNTIVPLHFLELYQDMGFEVSPQAGAGFCRRG